MKEYLVKIVLHEAYWIYVDAEDEEQAEDVAWEKLNNGEVEMRCAWDDTTVECEDE